MLPHLFHEHNLFNDVPKGVKCFERDFKGNDDHRPVRLVVFDFDETLTVSTFLPKDQNMRTSIGWNPEHANYIANVNFVPPWNPKRLIQLQEMFAELAGDADASEDEASPSQRRTLAVLTRNTAGAVACLNLLKAAGLAERLSVVWSMETTRRDLPRGVYKDSEGDWHTFWPPQNMPDYKADVLASVAQEPEAWFPQGCSGLTDLRLEDIVLVDDVDVNFESCFKGPGVLRCVKVATYDTEYLGMGYVTDMGGIGSHHQTDFQELIDFVSQPWKFRKASSKM